VFIGIGELLKPPYTHDGRQMRELFLNDSNPIDLLKPAALQLKLLVIPEADHSMAFPTTAIHGLTWLFKRNLS
jgi:hypothetical protein